MRHHVRYPCKSVGIVSFGQFGWLLRHRYRARGRRTWHYGGHLLLRRDSCRDGKGRMCGGLQYLADHCAVMPRRPDWSSRQPPGR